MDKQQWKLVEKRLTQLSGKYPQKGLAGSTTDKRLLLFIKNEQEKE